MTTMPNTSDLRLLFIYKNHRNDHCLQALKRWLPRMGINTYLFQFAHSERRRGDTPENRQISPRLAQAVAQFKPTHVLTWVWYINPEEVAWLKAQNIRVGAAISGVASFHNGFVDDQAEVMAMFRTLDYYFVPHAPHVPILRSLGVNAYEMPFFYDPDVYKPLPRWQRLWDMRREEAIFIGNFGSYGAVQREHREGAVKALAQVMTVRLISDHPLNVPQTRWNRPIKLHPVLNWLTNRSRFALCFDYMPELQTYQVPDSPIVQTPIVQTPIAQTNTTDSKLFFVRNRQVAMMAAGVAVMVERHPEIQRLFEDGREIILWDNVEEAQARARDYLANPAKLRAVAEAGYRSVAAQHTVQQRIQQMTAIMQQ